MIHYTLVRPNGKIYRPRKPPRVHLLGEDYDGVIVLGTHDLSLASELANAEVRRMVGAGFKADDWERGWYDLKMRRGEPTWVYDDAKGQAAVMFNEITDLW